MSEPSIPRRLWDLSLPVIGLNTLNVLALLVDTAMCGRLPNHEAALTGLGFASQIVFLLMVAMLGLVVGAVALVSRAHGAGETVRVEHLMTQSSQLTILMSIVVAIFGNVFAEPMMAMLGCEGEALREGLRYLRPLLTGTAALYLVMLYAALLRAVGNTRLAFLVAIGSNLVNIVLNYGLILGNYGLPALGVQGAAIGTVVSQSAAVIALLAVLRGGAVRGAKISIRPSWIDTGLARELFAVGAPAALDMVIFQASFMAIVGMLGRVDQVAVAAHGIGLRIQALAFVPGLGISQATSAMVGQALGANDEEQARQVTRASMALCFVVMSVIAAALIAGAEPIVVHAFDIGRGTDLANDSVMWMQILGAGMPVVGIHIALVGLLRGAGATSTSLWINVITTALLIPGSFVLGFVVGWREFGVWVAFPISIGLKMILEYGAYRHGGWARLGARM